VTCGIVGIIVAHFMANIITALSIFYSLMTVSLAAPFLFGLFSKKASVKGAFWSAGIGVVVTLALQFFNHGKGIWILNATSTGIICALVIMLVSIYIMPAPVAGEEKR
jgi:SSS family solute:Na+ symporter